MSASAEDHVWTLAAQFESDTLQVGFGGRFHNQMPHFGRTGEGHLIDIHVPGYRGACCRTIAGKNIHHAFRKARFDDQLADS